MEPISRTVKSLMFFTYSQSADGYRTVSLPFSSENVILLQFIRLILDTIIVSKAVNKKVKVNLVT